MPPILRVSLRDEKLSIWSLCREIMQSSAGLKGGKVKRRSMSQWLVYIVSIPRRKACTVSLRCLDDARRRSLLARSTRKRDSACTAMACSWSFEQDFACSVSADLSPGKATQRHTEAVWNLREKPAQWTGRWSTARNMRPYSQTRRRDVKPC